MALALALTFLLSKVALSCRLSMFRLPPTLATTCLPRAKARLSEAVAEQPNRLGVGDGAAFSEAEKLKEAALIQQLILERVVSQIVELLQDQYIGHQDGGYGGRPPLARDGRGTTISISSPNAPKSTCLLKPTSGSPSFERRFLRSSSANRPVLVCADNASTDFAALGKAPAILISAMIAGAVAAIAFSVLLPTFMPVLARTICAAGQERTLLMNLLTKFNLSS
jgi:hypothetical protein